MTEQHALTWMEAGMKKDLFPYGLDAPPVVRNLALGALACWLAYALSFRPWMPIKFVGACWPAAALSVAAFSMLWSSRYGKLRRREALLNKLNWAGNERVLDVGCGRGLLAVAAARRVPLGQVTGIDIWQQEDLSGNRPEAVAANASREGVAGRVDARTADMRELPFANASIDTVISSTAIHNIYDASERNRAIDEIVRVLRPAGQVMIDDIRHVAAYAQRLRDAGFELTITRGFNSWLWRLMSLGNLSPGTLIGHKPLQ
jgi:arsenite methyltransferase